jgi:branched-chain amino acid transport system permease protein
VTARALWLLAALAALACWPLVASDYWTDLGSQVLIAAMLASSLNILVGYAGLTSLGQAAFLGLSAYATALLGGAAGWPPLAAAAGALVITTAIAAFFAVIALRASWLGFLMITLALGQVVWGLAYRWVGLTQGDNGIGGVHRPQPLGIPLDTPARFYWAALLVAAAGVAAIAVMARSPFGAVLTGTRDQPRRMAALGHNVWRVRFLAFVLSGFWAGVAGVMFIFYTKYIHPSSLSLSASAEPLLGVIAGGTGTIAGPLVGAALVTLLKTYVSTYVERWNMLLGAVFVLIVLFLPEGLVPGIARLLRGSGSNGRGGKG